MHDMTESLGDDDPRSFDARVKTSLEHSEAIRSALAAIVLAPIRPRSSIAVVLEVFRDEIIAAHEHGISARRIATALQIHGVAFSAGSLRHAVQRMVGADAAQRKAAPRHSSRRATGSSPATPPPILLSVTPEVRLPARSTARPARSEPAPTNAIDRLNEEL